jgi:hypothetical protein
MIQPTKNELRHLLAQARQQLKEEKSRRELAEAKLKIATHQLREMVIETELQEQSALPAPQPKILRRLLTNTYRRQGPPQLAASFLCDSVAMPCEHGNPPGF